MRIRRVDGTRKREALAVVWGTVILVLVGTGKTWDQTWWGSCLAFWLIVENRQVGVRHRPARLRRIFSIGRSVPPVEFCQLLDLVDVLRYRRQPPLAIRLRDLPLDPFQTSGHLPAVRRGGVEPPEEADQLADVVPGVVVAGRRAIPSRRTAPPMIDHRLAHIVVQRVQGDVGVVLPETLNPLQPP